MNLKGIEITKKMYKKISDFGVSNLKASTLHGLNEFKKFNWSQFSKQEFSALINCMDILDKNDIFMNISDSQLFIFNYTTDVTEMDIATVLIDKENNNIIVDIEYKSGDEAEEKLDEQIVKRKLDHMEQLFLNEKYIIIAMTDNGFYRANYFNGKKNIDIFSINILKNLLTDFSNSDYTETILTRANDLAGIHNLFYKIESGEFKYYEETKRSTEHILKKIDEGKKAIVCLSGPGTGKTVVAFKLFFEMNNSVLLMMNKKFYKSLGLSKYYENEKCFFGTDTLLNHDLSQKNVIIDEVQRLNKEKILNIVNASKSAILIGDSGQAFMEDDLDLNNNSLLKYLKENGIDVHKKELKRNKRYNDSVEKALNFLSSRSLSLKDNVILEDYKINIFYNADDFIESYKKCSGGKKMFTTYDYRNIGTVKIGNQLFQMAEREFYDFAISTGYDYHIGHTLHAISFDVENNYVFLENVRVINKNGKDILTKAEHFSNDEERITKFLNELNILFTRGKKTLNIYTDNFEVYLFLNKKLKCIQQK